TLERELRMAVNRSGEVYYDENGNSNFDSIYKPLADSLFEKSGRVDIGEKLSHTDRDLDAYQALTKLSPQQKAALLNSNPQTEEEKAIQRSVFNRFDSPAEKQLAQEIITTGQFNELNQLRAATITDQSLQPSERDTVKEILGKVKPEDRTAFNNAYAKQYYDNLTNVLNKIPREEQASFQSLLQGTGKTRAEQVEELAQNRRQGESGLLGNFESGVQEVSIQNNQTLLKASETASAKFEDLPLEKQQALFNNASETYAKWQQDKAERANQVTDGVLIGGSLLLTAGASAPVVLSAAAAGGTVKVVGNKALIGDNYGSVEEVTTDFSKGSLNTLLNTLGPAQAASALKLGNNLSREATETIVTKLAQESVELGSSKLLQEGSEQVIQKELNRLIQTSIVDGSDTVSQKAIKQLVSKVATEGNEEVVKKVITTSLTESTEALAKRNIIQKVATEQGLNASSAYVGGVGSGTIEGLSKWDPALSTEENIKRTLQTANENGVTSAASAIALTTIIKGGLHAFGKISKGAENDIEILVPKFAQRTERSVDAPIIVRDGLTTESDLVLRPEFSHITPDKARDELADLYLESYDDFHTTVLTRADRDFVKYILKNGTTEILIEKDFEPQVINLRNIRREYKKNPTDPILALQYHSTKQLLLPEDIAEKLVNLPDSGNGIKQIYLRNKAHSPQDLWNTIENLSPRENADSLQINSGGRKTFISAANANIEDGKINFYNGTTTDSVMNTLRHEWAHIQEGIEKSNRSVFEDALKLESPADRFNNGSTYALKNSHENWAVNLGENILDTKSTKYLDIIDQVKDTSSAPKYWVLIHSLSRTIERARFNLPANDELGKLLARVAYAERQLYPKVEKQLLAALTSADGDTANKLSAFRLLARTGQASTLPKLTKFADELPLKKIAEEKLLEDISRLQNPFGEGTYISPHTANRIETSLTNPNLNPEERAAALSLALRPEHPLTNGLVSAVQSSQSNMLSSELAPQKLLEAFPEGVPLKLALAIQKKESLQETSIITEKIMHHWLENSHRAGMEQTLEALDTGRLTKLWSENKLSFGKGLILHVIEKAGKGKEEEYFALVMDQLKQNPDLQIELLEHAHIYKIIEPAILERYKRK
ncbi:MAG: hypothetical protein SFV17_15200, partial [Candidatus Obscuribacter sp.]|nr:hypothetical protein [Candidatus Obscuribacter sp.]